MIIEIIPVSSPNVSSRAPRRNNSLAFETIFRLACRHPETFADYQFAQRSAKAQSPGACHAERHRHQRSNTSAILRACVAKLSPAHREIINLVYYDEKSVEEVGAIIGIPQSTVKTRMFYARKQLADLLRGAGVDSLAA